MLLSQRFDEALRYATIVHAGQVRKGTAIPYISHLMAVAGIVLDYGGDEDEAIAALLHDAPEDQGGKPRLDDIRSRFGDRVAGIVEACSDSLAERPSEKQALVERKAAHLKHLEELNDPSVFLVSMADKLHNARCTAADLRRYGASVWDRFKGKRDLTIHGYENLVAVFDNGADNRTEALLVELKRAVAELVAHANGDRPPAIGVKPGEN